MTTTITQESKPVAAATKPVFHVVIECDEETFNLQIRQVETVPPECFRRHYQRGYQFDLHFHYSPTAAAYLTQESFRLLTPVISDDISFRTGLKFRTPAQNQRLVRRAKKKWAAQMIDDPLGQCF